MKALHAPGRLLVLPNAWDATSARLAQRAGAQAVATTSAGVAWAHGYPDGERLPLDVLVSAVRDMRRVLDVPLTVDFERGYSAVPSEVAENVARLEADGVNLEDGGAAPELLAEKVRAVKQRSPHVFVNARTCVVLHRVPGADVLERARAYAAAGADGFFVPGLVDAEQISAVVSGTDLPLNVMAWPGLPSLPELRRLGVRRLSVGTKVAATAYAAAEVAMRRLLEGHDFVSPALDYRDVQALLG
jgi:2-methylisocitrate lyase-like PEP mutase family enzyme